MRYPGVLWVQAIAVVVVVAGCGGGSSPVTTYLCDPPCPTGTRCAADGCVADGEPSFPDGAVPDLPAGCQPPCQGATPYCSPTLQCVPCLTDAHCPIGQRCTAAGAGAVCVPGCDSDERCGGGAGGEAFRRCCGGQCADTRSDAQHCGSCDQACALPHAASACVDAACSAGACSPGWGDCNHQPADGCEANLHVDGEHCGSCDRRCALGHAATRCSDACYLAACDFGYDDCNGDEGDGCETAVVTDPRNCGACGVNCAPLPHARNSCVNAACQLVSCDQGFADCNGDPADGCETTVGTDARNCGTCGNACGQGLVCRNGGCTCPQCNLPNARASCVNNQCVLAQCLDGFADCDGVVMNGCEVVTATDPRNCGRCNNVCPMNMAGCDQGACTDQFYGLLSYWKFDGDFRDAVGGNDLAPPNGQQAPGFAPGKLGDATSSPTGDPQNLWIAALPDGIDNAADFTLAFWGRSNASTWYDSYAVWDSGGLVVFRHQQDSWRFLVWTQDVNNVTVQFDSGVNLNKPPDPTWFLVVVYRSGSTLGIKINDGPPVTAQVGQLKQGPSLYVSRNNAGYSWPGQLDEMGYWTRALTDGEMTALYNGGNGRTFP